MGLDASHLVHMPSHIYYWVGRYQDAANANIAAVTICHAEMARFEDPNAVLALSEPKLPYLAAAWHYARGEAYTYLGDSAAALIEAGEIPVSINPVGDGDELSAPEQMLAITRGLLHGRVAMMEGRHHDAAAHFAEAAEIEETDDVSWFSDPPAFWYPVRRNLAGALLLADDLAGAKREAEATLKLRPLDLGALALLEKIEVAANEVS